MVHKAGHAGAGQHHVSCQYRISISDQTWSFEAAHNTLWVWCGAEAAAIAAGLASEPLWIQLAFRLHPKAAGPVLSCSSISQLMKQQILRPLLNLQHMTRAHSFSTLNIFCRKFVVLHFIFWMPSLAPWLFVMTARGWKILLPNTSPTL